MEDNGMAKGLVIGLLAGAVFGVAVGMLYAPKSGAETREMLKEKAVEAREKAMEAREKAGEMVEKVKERAQAMRGCGRQALRSMSASALGRRAAITPVTSGACAMAARKSP